MQSDDSDQFSDSDEEFYENCTSDDALVRSKKNVGLLKTKLDCLCQTFMEPYLAILIMEYTGYVGVLPRSFMSSRRLLSIEVNSDSDDDDNSQSLVSNSDDEFVPKPPITQRTVFVPVHPPVQQRQFAIDPSLAHLVHVLL